MITREQFLAAYSHEMHCIRHLATKITPDMLEYRPTPAQRSLLELLQYISYASVALAEAAIVSMDHYMDRMKSGESTTLENFQQKMHDQEQELHAMISGVSDESLAQEVDVYGVKTRAGHLTYQLQMITAYKMQLFLYIKSCGVSTIGTMDLWVGMDTPPKVD